MIRKDKARVDVYGDRFRSRGHQLTPRLLQVARYINENREAVMEQTAMEIAALLKTSDATVVRAIQALGFAGLRDLKQTLEQWFGPVVSSSEKMSTTVNTLTSDVNASIDFVLEGHQHTCDVLSEPHNRYAMAQAVSLLAQARQVAIFGIGASGILAEYTSRLFSRIGLPAIALNRTGIGLAEQLIALQRGDVLVMMAQKSAHREGQTTLREAKRLGIPTILLTNATDSRFSKEASVVIHVPRGGEKGKIPLHGTVLLCLEMIILSVASTEPQRTIRSMKRIQAKFLPIVLIQPEHHLACHPLTAPRGTVVIIRQHGKQANQQPGNVFAVQRRLITAKKIIDMLLAMRQVSDPGLATTTRQLLQTLLSLRKITQGFQYGMLVEMNNGAPVKGLCLLVHHHLMQGKRWEEKQPPGAHGVVTVIDNRHAKAFFHIENFQTLMPVVIAHRIGEQAAKRHHGVI